MKNNLQEISVSLVLVVLLVTIANPFHFWMPSMLHLAVLAAVLVAFGFFASIILRERVVDERDGVHRMLAGRAAFLAGSLTLVIGIIYQSFLHTLDVWLVGALVAMIVVKLGSRIYSDRNL